MRGAELCESIKNSQSSSGKSSVLEGLTGLPFPRDSTLCTRFATQITFRRASTTNIKVSIIPDRNTSKDNAERLKAWKKTGLTSLGRKDFSQILDEVSNVICWGLTGFLPPPGIDRDGASRFTK